MIDRGKQNLIGINISAVDYGRAVAKILDCAQNGRPCSTTALAVHGLVTGARDLRHRFRLNEFDLRRAGRPKPGLDGHSNALHGVGPPDQSLTGLKLTFLRCQRSLWATARHSGSYLWEATPEVIHQPGVLGLAAGLPVWYQDLVRAHPNFVRSLMMKEQPSFAGSRTPARVCYSRGWDAPARKCSPGR